MKMILTTHESRQGVAMYYRFGTHQQVMHKGLKVVCYARSKTREELKCQVKKLRAYCEKEQFEIIDIQQELCEGSSHDRLPLCLAMINKEADAIVVTDSSRLSRNVEFVVELIEKLRKNNKFVIDATIGNVIDINPVLRIIF